MVRLIKWVMIIAKSRGIKGYQRMSEDRLLSALNASESLKRNKTTKGIRKKSIILIKYLKTQETFFG